LALRLAVHDAVTETTGSPPILLLDDVFSELDPSRCAALLAALPVGQARIEEAVAELEHHLAGAEVAIIDRLHLEDP
jgi:recombinational DNA repair ATPase RecF